MVRQRIQGQKADFTKNVKLREEQVLGIAKLLYAGGVRVNARIQGFVEEIRKWYRVHKRSLPWRDLSLPDSTERAYRILVSEVMLQQTQVDRVKGTFVRFLEAFPLLSDLAEASNRSVLLAWRGMGYNSRALRLRDAAKIVAERFGGTFPRSMEELLSIKGIGRYTAAAIRNFAFDIPTACLDTNIRRILHRTFVGPENPDGTWEKNDRCLLVIAEEVLDAAIERGIAPSAWHAALMDFGSLVQTKRNPKWDACPLTEKRLMKTTKENLKLSRVLKRKEPGRTVGSKFIPNRIFRGKVVEELRDSPRGLSFEEIGERVCLDWSIERHERWLKELIDSLKRDAFIAERGSKFLLVE